MRTRLFHSDAVRVLLAALMLLTPSAAIQAQQPATEIDTKYLTQDTVLAASIRPKQILSSPQLELLPYEVFQALAKEEFGIAPFDVEQVMIVVQPPTNGSPEPVVVVRFARQFKFEELTWDFAKDVTKGQLAGDDYWKSSSPVRPSFLMPDDRTLIAGSDASIVRLANVKQEPQPGPLAELLQSAPGKHDVFVAAHLEPVRPMILAALQSAPPLPPQLEGFKQAPQRIESAHATVHISDGQLLKLVVNAKDDQSAQQLEKLVLSGLQLWRQRMMAAFAQAEQSDDLVEQAMARYMQRISGDITAPYDPTRDGHQLVFGGVQDDEMQLLNAYATTGILVALLLPAVQAAREAARRNTCRNNLRQIGIALHNYHDVHGHFPAPASYDEDGNPLLSWRVHLLPFMEEARLYDQFHLDEPWDSEHNKQLIKEMPQIYRCPSSTHVEGDFHTCYVAPVGKGHFFEQHKEVSLRDLKDGTSRTIALVEADDAIAPIWTQPQDVSIDPQDPVRGMGGLHPGIFIAVYADDHVEEVRLDIDKNVLKALFTRSGGEEIRPFR